MTDYSKLKVAELKDLIKERGIASTGLKVKQNYVDALIAHDGEGGGEGGAEQVADDADEQTEPVAETEMRDAKDEQIADSTMEDEAIEKDGAAQDDSEELGNKRKRRSPTPPMSEESVSKKVKTLEEKTEADVEVKLPEDVETDAPVPMDEESNNKTTLPSGSSDDVMDIQQDGNDSRRDATNDDALPSKHAVTRALYIRDLVRPLQPNVLREHLLSLAQQRTAADASIEDFHLDKLRSHAFVLFDSTSAATVVRNVLHNQIWPEEPMRKPLWVDYVPEDQVRDWIETEVSRGDLTRWEVVYTSTGMDTDGPVTASLQEIDAGAINARNTTRQPTGAGEGMPNAPSGPRRQSTQYQQPPQHSPEEDRRPPRKTNDVLDDMYPFTHTKPKIYYQPVPRELVDRRLEEFEKEKSRDWDDRFADPAAYAEGELRRYTFEDGDRLVDGGADFGLFGRNPRGGMRGGGRGRGRGGDRYRGGGRR